MGDVGDGDSPAPIDRAVLEQMRSRFLGRRMFESAEIGSEGNLHLRVALASDYYPGERTGRFEIRWYRNDDFKTTCGNVGGTGIQTITTRGRTFIRRPMPAVPSRKTPSGRPIIGTCVAS